MDERKKIIVEYFKEHSEIGLKYFESIASTRKSKKISLNIIKKEIEYYNKYDFKIVLQALKLHLKSYQDKKEQYTRGIIRNLDREAKNGGNKGDFGQGLGTKERDQRLAKALEI